MNRITKCMLAAALAGAVTFTPAANASILNPVTTVYAHGHHNSHHSSTNYYYCGGHAAHTHAGGVCPYTDHYYYCSGHAAHTHTNGVCPYASMSRTTIKKVQKKLNSCGYRCGLADGVVGAKTKSALKKFQKANGLKADGIIGKTTLKALGIKS